VNPIEFALYYGIFMCYCLSFGIGLTFKAAKKRLSNVIFFGLFYILYGTYFLLLLLKDFDSLSFISDGGLEIIYCCSIMFVFLFNYITLFDINKPFFKVVFSACIVLSIASSVLGFWSSSETGIGVYNLFDLIRYFLDDCITMQLIILPAVYAAVKIVIKARTGNIPSYIQTRYILYIVSLLEFSIAGLFNFIGTVFPNLYSFYVIVVIGLLGLSGILVNYFVWFFPASRIKIRGNVEFEDQFTDHEEIRARLNEKLSTSRVMNIIDYFGNILAERIEKSSAGAKGLLIIAITHMFGEDAIYNITIDELGQVFEGELKNLLTALDITVPEHLLQDMGTELEKQRLFFTMAKL
jgi:hypothetical protein